MAATSLAASLTAPPRRESTTAAGRGSAGGPVLHRRVVAMVTAVSCAAHVWLAVSGHHGPLLSVLMLALAAVCVPCTVHIWRHSRVGALQQVTGAAVAMAVLHAVLLLTAGGPGGDGHAHGGAPSSSAAAGPEGSTQLLLIIGLELVAALLAATLVARLRTRAGRAALYSSDRTPDACI